MQGNRGHAWDVQVLTFIFHICRQYGSVSCFVGRVLGRAGRKARKAETTVWQQENLENFAHSNDGTGQGRSLLYVWLCVQWAAGNRSCMRAFVEKMNITASFRLSLHFLAFCHPHRVCWGAPTTSLMNPAHNRSTAGLHGGVWVLYICHYYTITQHLRW